MKRWRFDLCQKFNSQGNPVILPWRSLQQRDQEKRARKREVARLEREKKERKKEKKD